MSEVSSKLTRVILEGTQPLWQMRVCKGCRGEFLEIVRDFIELPPMLEEDRPDANIPVRLLGRTVMMTRHEYETWRRNQ